jgi:hypothetical protein
MSPTGRLKVMLEPEDWRKNWQLQKTKSSSSPDVFPSPYHDQQPRRHLHTYEDLPLCQPLVDLEEEPHLVVIAPHFGHLPQLYPCLLSRMRMKTYITSHLVYHLPDSLNNLGLRLLHGW